MTEDKPLLFTLEDEKKFSSEIDKDTIAAVQDVAARQLLSLNEDQSFIPLGLRMKVAKVSESLSVFATYKTHLESSLSRDVTVAASSIGLLDLKSPSSVNIKSLRHTKIIAEDLLRQLEVCKGDDMDVSDISESVSTAVEFINGMGPELRQVMETLSAEQDLQQDVEQIQLIADLPYETLEAMCSVGDELSKLSLSAAHGNMKVKTGFTLLSQELRQLLVQSRAGNKFNYKKVRSIVSVTFGSPLSELVMAILDPHIDDSISTDGGAVPPVSPIVSVKDVSPTSLSSHVACNVNKSTDFIRDEAVREREFVKALADLELRHMTALKEQELRMVREKMSLELEIAKMAMEYEAKLKIERMKMEFENDEIRLRSEAMSQCNITIMMEQLQSEKLEFEKKLAADASKHEYEMKMKAMEVEHLKIKLESDNKLEIDRLQILKENEIQR